MSVRKTDARSFRTALSNFATGVTIVAVKDSSGENVGVTASSFNSVSIDPPLVLWSLSKSARSLKSFEDAEYFVVNVLASDQVSLSKRFATSGEVDKFQGVKFTEGVGGAPVLAGCAANFQCRKSFVYEGGDHLILVGEVMQFDSSGRAGLVFHKGSYAVSQPHPVSEVAKTASSKNHDFVEVYLDYLLTQTAERFRGQFQVVLDRAGVHTFEWRTLACLAENNEGLTYEQLCEMTLVYDDELDRLIRSMQDRSWISSGDDFSGETRYWIASAGLETVVPLIAAARAHESDALGRFSAEQVQTFKENLMDLLQWVDSGNYEPAHLVPENNH